MGHLLRRWSLLLLLLPATLLQAQEARPLLFGVLPYLSTRILITTYSPLAAYLEHRLGRPVSLQTAPDFDTFTSRAFAGEYDLLLIAPHYARLAEVDYGYIPLLRHRNDIRCYLMVPREQPLASLEQLRGQTVAIHERSAMVPMLGLNWLAEKGLVAERDFRVVENVTQSSALQSVVSGKARAAIVSHSTVAQAPADLREATRIAGECPSAPGLALMAHNRLPPAERQRIKEVLNAFEQTPEGKVFFDISTHGGYREPTPADARLMDKVLPETRRLLKK